MGAKIAQPVEPTEPMIFGCRSPNSKGLGMWDGAFIWAQDSEGKRMGFIFDKTEYFARTSYKEAKKDYNRYIFYGWTPMTLEDIEKTSGIKGIPLIPPSE